MGNVISRGEGSSLHLQSKALLISENWQKASAKKETDYTGRCQLCVR